MKAFVFISLAASLLLGTTLNASDLHLNSETSTSNQPTQAIAIPINFQLSYLLLEAAKNGDTTEIKRLLALDAPIDAVDPVDMTPLHFAAYKGYTEAVRVFLAAGAPIDKADDKGMTPLHCAAMHGRAAAQKSLKAEGAQ